VVVVLLLLQAAAAAVQLHQRTWQQEQRLQVLRSSQMQCAGQ
jgi:hypothetical protein